MHSNFIQLITY